MNDSFRPMFSKEPVSEKNGVIYYGSEFEGDQFDEKDAESWTSGGKFMHRWRNKGLSDKYRNEVYMDLCRKADDLKLPIMDIASGPGLGLLPDIYSFNTKSRILAADGCPLIAEKWSEFLNENEPSADISFASFNAADMPIFSDSVDVITSNIGFSSLRYAGADNMLGIREAFRVLKHGGYIFTIENEFEDNNVVQKVFDLWGRENWFKNNKLSWRERFEQAGFVIEQEKLHLRRDDNDFELGEIAASFGLEIIMVYKAFILRKF